MKLDILHTNDIHSNIEKLARASAYIKNVRDKNKNVLLIDAGDMITGDFQFKFNEGRAERYINNYLNYDVVTIGNHDFDLGLDFLKDHMNGIDAEYVLSNVLDKDHLIGDFTPILTQEMNGLKVGFIGFILPQIVNEMTDDEFFDYIPVEGYQKVVDDVRSQGVDLVIAVNHQGIKADQIFANELQGVDVIISSHSHTTLSQPEKIKETLIVQTGCFAVNIGHLQLDVVEGKVNLLDYQLIALESLEEIDEVLQSEINNYLENANAHAREVYGSCAHDLEGRREYMTSQSTDLGSLICDSYIDFARELGYSPDFAFINARGLRQSIPAGEITYRELYNVMPFEKHLLVLNIKGRDLLSALDNKIDLQTSHLKILKDSEGNRKIFDQEVNRPIIADKVYQFVTLTYLYEHPAFSDLRKAELVADDIAKDTEAVSKYIKKLGRNFSYQPNGMVENVEQFP